jgi:hypothetical protein
MRYATGTIDRVRSTMKSANPVPNDAPVQRWDDQPVREALYSIMATGSTEAAVPQPPRRPNAGRPRHDSLPRPGARPSWRLRRVLAPAAATAAVTAVVLGMTLARVLTRPGTGAPAATSRAPRLAAGVPRFYVTLSPQPGPRPGLVAAVHASATGQILSRAVIPASTDDADIAADGSDRAYLIDYASSADRQVLLLLQVAANGRSATLTRLAANLAPSLGPSGWIDGLAVSPDGKQVALALQVSTNDGQASYGEILVYPTSGGRARAWTGPAGVAAPAPGNPEWTASSQLTFAWPGHLGNHLYFVGGQIRVLDTRSAGGSLLRSKELMTTGNLTTIQGAAAGPGDSPLIVALINWTASSTATSGRATVQLLSLSTAGKVLRVLASHTVAYHNGEQLAGIDRTFRVFGCDQPGRDVLVLDPGFSRLDGRTLTPLPGSATTIAAAW